MDLISSRLGLGHAASLIYPALWAFPNGLLGSTVYRGSGLATQYNRLDGLGCRSGSFFFVFK